MVKNKCGLNITFLFQIQMLYADRGTKTPKKYLNHILILIMDPEIDIQLQKKKITRYLKEKRFISFFFLVISLTYN